jgi:hypothetical protein
MASYFDLPPQQKAGAAHIEALPEEQRKQFSRMSILSPAVTQLLDDLGQDQSDSDSGEGNTSEEHTQTPTELTKKSDLKKSSQIKGLDNQPAKNSPLSPRKAANLPKKKSTRVKSPPARAGGGESLKLKQPHMARFHSLRSMLFSNTIEDKIKNVTQEDCAKEEAAANKWRDQHAQRQMHSRPKTPEKDAQGKGHGLGSRLKTSIRRMTTKEVPTMQTLKEDGAAHDFSDHGSTASSDNEDEPYQRKPRELDEESMHHSDVEDIVRWVSRRDPPSDGEARATGKAPLVADIKEDGDESMGNSDVDDLVQWMSRKSSDPRTMEDHHVNYSDASTESDSEILNANDCSDEEEDADDLVRWISHRDGPTAGPVRHKRGGNSNSSQEGSYMSYDSDVPELGRWVTRHDGTSGESGATTPVHDLLEEPERGRPRSRDCVPRPQAKTYVTHDDIDELVSWVSRKDSKQTSPPMHVEEIGRSGDDAENPSGRVKASNTSSQADGFEAGDLRQLRMTEPGANKSRAQDYLRESRGESKPMDKQGVSVAQKADAKVTGHRDSLGNDDVDDLIQWVSRRK